MLLTHSCSPRVASHFGSSTLFLRERRHLWLSVNGNYSRWSCERWINNSVFWEATLWSETVLNNIENGLDAKVSGIPLAQRVRIFRAAVFGLFTIELNPPVGHCTRKRNLDIAGNVTGQAWRTFQDRFSLWESANCAKVVFPFEDCEELIIGTNPAW